MAQKRYEILASSTHAVWGEPVTLADASTVEAIPNYVDTLYQMPTGEQDHIVGWELVFRSAVAVAVGDKVIWRGQDYRITLTRDMRTHKRCMIVEI